MHHDETRILPASDGRKLLAGRFPGAGTALHRIVDVEIAPLDPERLGEVSRERLHPVAFGRVVPCRDQVDAELARGRLTRLLGLPGEQRVEARVCGANQIVPCPSGRDGEPLDPFGAVGEDERRPPDNRFDALGELGDRDGRERAGEPDTRERSFDGCTDALGELGGVAERRVRVEREVIGEQRRVRLEQRLEPAALAGVDRRGARCARRGRGGRGSCPLPPARHARTARGSSRHRRRAG